MSLSQENIDKLCITGIYHCDPVLSWIESWRRNDPYHCINWNFKVRYYEEKDLYYMIDTYWSGYEGLRIKLTDENFNKFELLFDMNEVHKVSPPDFWDYNDKNLEMCLMRYNYHRVFLIRNLDTKNIYNLTYKED